MGAPEPHVAGGQDAVRGVGRRREGVEVTRRLHTKGEHGYLDEREQRVTTLVTHAEHGLKIIADADPPIEHHLGGMLWRELVTPPGREVKIGDHADVVDSLAGELSEPGRWCGPSQTRWVLLGEQALRQKLGIGYLAVHSASPGRDGSWGSGRASCPPAPQRVEPSPALVVIAVAGFDRARERLVHRGLAGVAEVSVEGSGLGDGAKDDAGDSYVHAGGFDVLHKPTTQSSTAPGGDHSDRGQERAIAPGWERERGTANLDRCCCRDDEQRVSRSGRIEYRCIRGSVWSNGRVKSAPMASNAERTSSASLGSRSSISTAT